MVPTARSRDRARRRDTMGCSHRRSFDNLIMRYEEPNSMQRWDAPLFTVPWDEALPADDIWAAVTKGEKKPPTGAVVTVGVCRLLLAKPHAAWKATTRHTADTDEHDHGARSVPAAAFDGRARRQHLPRAVTTCRWKTRPPPAARPQAHARRAAAPQAPV